MYRKKFKDKICFLKYIFVYLQVRDKTECFSNTNRKEEKIKIFLFLIYFFELMLYLYNRK